MKLGSLPGQFRAPPLQLHCGLDRLYATRLPQQWLDREQPETADRLQLAVHTHPSRQAAALTPACFAARRIASSVATP